MATTKSISKELSSQSVPRPSQTYKKATHLLYTSYEPANRIQLKTRAKMRMFSKKEIHVHNETNIESKANQKQESRAFSICNYKPY